MIDNSQDSLIDIDNKITVYDDAYFLAFKLREAAEEYENLSGDESVTPYVLKEAAVTLEGLFSAYRSLLFQATPKRKIPLNEVELSTRTRTVLEDAGYIYLDDVLLCSDAKLLRMKNFGSGSLKELKRFNGATEE